MVKMDYEEVEGPATEVVVEAQAGERVQVP
jgi:hypothetical protein